MTTQRGGHYCSIEGHAFLAIRFPSQLSVPRSPSAADPDVGAVLPGWEDCPRPRGRLALRCQQRLCFDRVTAEGGGDLALSAPAACG